VGLEFGRHPIADKISNLEKKEKERREKKRRKKKTGHMFIHDMHTRSFFGMAPMLKNIKH
jgi:hypothetical protein